MSFDESARFFHCIVRGEHKLGSGELRSPESSLGETPHAIFNRIIMQECQNILDELTHLAGAEPLLPEEEEGS